MPKNNSNTEVARKQEELIANDKARAANLLLSIRLQLSSVTSRITK